MKPIPILPAIIFCVLAQLLFSCTKKDLSVQQDVHKLGILSEEKIIRINQAVDVYDSTAVTDSIDFSIPTPGKYYEWTVIPQNGCDSIFDEHHKGIVSIIFHCPGAYRVTGKIYDSIGRNFLGNTDTTEVIVVNEMLFPSQPIKPNDILKIQASLQRGWNDPNSPSTAPPDFIYIGLAFYTTEEYDYYEPYIQFDMTTNTTLNNYSYTFNNVRLTTYPFAFGYGIKSRVGNLTELKNLSIGTPVNLNVTWLGKTYQGTITLVNENAYKVNWDNSGAVRFE